LFGFKPKIEEKSLQKKEAAQAAFAAIFCNKAIENNRFFDSRGELFQNLH